MLSALRMTVLASRLLASGVDKYDYRTAAEGAEGAGDGGSAADLATSTSNSASASTGTGSSGSNSNSNSNSRSGDSRDASPSTAETAETGPASVDQVEVVDPTLVDPGLDYKDALFLSTLGGAKALGLGDRVGSFRRGFFFDALLVVPGDKGRRSRVYCRPSDQIRDRLEKFLHCGDDRDIASVWVQGRCRIKDGLPLSSSGSSDGS